MWAQGESQGEHNGITIYNKFTSHFSIKNLLDIYQKKGYASFKCLKGNCLLETLVLQVFLVFGIFFQIMSFMFI